MLANRYPAPRLQRATRSEASTADGLGTYKQSAPGTVCSIGSPVIPVVMVNFADRTFTDTIDATKVTRFFNEQGYADEQGSKGSVKDYFTAQSQGLFTPTFSVVATVTLPKGYAYYGANSTSGRIDEHITDFITDALAQAEKNGRFLGLCHQRRSPPRQFHVCRTGRTIFVRKRLRGLHLGSILHPQFHGQSRCRAHQLLLRGQ